jgi:hypothetical protein
VTPPPAPAERFRAVVLAGERPGGGALARELGLPAGVLAPLAGQPCLARVLRALGEARAVAGGLVCGPARDVVDGSEALRTLLGGDEFRWIPPEAGPAASAVAAIRAEDGFPRLLTSGDHGLLTAAVVDRFCSAASRAAAGDRVPDLLVGLVPHPLVAAAFPRSRRTVLEFADGAFCGSNLFALMTPASRRGLAFWSTVEADRKRPLRLARHLGVTTLLRYATRRLTVADAFAHLSAKAGCRVDWVSVPEARAAVDVDSRDDWTLANRLLTADAAVEARQPS